MKRRNFIKSGTSAISAFAGLSIIPSTVLGKSTSNLAPSDKVNLACCGNGQRDGGITKSLFNTGYTNMVALCDVNIGAPHTREVMDMFLDVSRLQGNVRYNG